MPDADAANPDRDAASAADEGIIDVWGECGEFSFSGRSWRLLLSFARAHGWKPDGTLPPVDEDLSDHWTPGMTWDGRYFPGETQVLTTPDALKLATALDAALDDLPSLPVIAAKTIEVKDFFVQATRQAILARLKPSNA